MDEEKKAWLILNMFTEVGSRTFLALQKQFGFLKNVLTASLSELKEASLSSPLAEKIFHWRRQVNIEEELKLIERLKVKVITLNEGIYPRYLRLIYDPPPVLYCLGEIKKEDELAISVVGSRKTSPYGRQMAKKLSEKLVEYGFTIISGLARGIDTVAHRAALEAEGRTIAVLGSGLNVIYPPENYQLVAEIAQRGAVISEFPLQTPPYRNHFPRRNRIIAGFSLGTVVVEAGEKSGSLITANYALEQGREVFAVPGNTTSLLSKGTNHLIKQGAKLVAEVEDIIEELRIYFPDLKKEKREKKIILTEEEERVYQVLTEEPKHIEQIVQEINAPVNKILGVLMRLELKKLVKQQPGKFFSR